MPIIEYDATGFPATFGQNLQGHRHLSCTWADIFRAAIKVGRPSWGYVYRYGTYSHHEANYKRYLIKANLRESGSRSIIKTEVYESLDPSEKSGVSYFLGLISASLLCEILLQVPWIVHFDVFGHLFPSFATSGRRRPDLIGANLASDYVVVESKGRTNAASQSVAVEAKQQALAVNTIGGKTPIARIASVTHFRDGGLSVFLHDPEVKSEEPIDIPIENEKFARDSYGPVLSLLSATPQVEAISIAGRQYVLANIPGTEDRIGLVSEIAEATSISGVASSLSNEIEPVSEELVSIGRDGVIVELGSTWTTEEMRLEPVNRSA